MLQADPGKFPSLLTERLHQVPISHKQLWRAAAQPWARICEDTHGWGEGWHSPKTYRNKVAMGSCFGCRSNVLFLGNGLLGSHHSAFTIQCISDTCWKRLSLLLPQRPSKIVFLLPYALPLPLTHPCDLLPVIGHEDFWDTSAMS